MLYELRLCLFSDFLDDRLHSVGVDLSLLLPDMVDYLVAPASIFLLQFENSQTFGFLGGLADGFGLQGV